MSAILSETRWHRGSEGDCKPLYVSRVDDEDIARGDGEYIADFIETCCRITKTFSNGDYVGNRGDLIRLMPWQRFALDRVFARRASDGWYVHEEAFIAVPRKNGKSEMISAIAIYCLLYLPAGSDIVVAAKDTKQASIVFQAAKDMVSLDPSLSKRITPYKYTLQCRSNGNTFKVLSADAPSLEGLNCSVIIIDEFHTQPNRELYDVLVKSQVNRPNPLLISITTAGVRTQTDGEPTICFERFEHGKKVVSGETIDPKFFFLYYGAEDSDDWRDEATHRKANPGYGVIQKPSHFEREITRSTESDFKRKHLNIWTNSQYAWLPAGKWAACKTDQPFTPGPLGVVLGFDGSRNNDNTALVAVTIEAEPQIKVLGLWQRPPKDDPAYYGWDVPRAEVKDAIRDANRTYTVREIAADPSLWQDALEDLAAEKLPVVDFPQSPSRMVPATQRFFEMVTDTKLHHDGDPRLAAHLDHAIVRNGQIRKENESSNRKIDLAVASIIAVERVSFYLNEAGLPGCFEGTDIPIEGHQYVY